MSNNRNNDGMPEETMQTDELNADSFGDGMIEIGDTRLPDAVIRVQKEVDAIGWLGADMRVIGMAYFRNPDVFWKRRVPEKLNLYEKRIDGHERRMPNSRRARAVDMSAIRRDCPINSQEFTVLIHFRAGCREKAQDKVKRMLRSDVQNAELSA